MVGANLMLLSSNASLQADIQALHNLRQCRQVIQLYGYLPNANAASGQSPALLVQQPSYGSLRQFLSHNYESIQWPERYKLALDIAQGLRFLTAQGVPCTVNSGNILVDNEGVAILTGFGSPGGMITSAPCQMTSQPSGPSLVVYMAPERIMGLGGYCLEWSLYSLGVLLWELSSGRMPFEEIITRAESGPRLAKNMEQLSSAIVKGLREEAIPGTPEIYEQLYKMCWAGDAESRPPLEVVEETLQMLVVVEPMDMLMLPGEEMSMPISSVVSESIDGDAISAHTPTRSNSVRSESPGPTHARNGGHNKPATLHEAVSVSNADMTEWYVLAGHDLNGYAIVPTFSLECEITPIQTCLGHYMPSSLVIFKELMEQDVDVKLLAKRSLQNCLHILLDRYIPFKNEKGSSHLFIALDMLLAAGVEVNALDVQGNTPLHLLMRNPKISSDDVAECLKRMVAKGADTSIHTPKDGNVLTLAAKYLHFEAAKFILSTDILASEADSIDRAIEACMTMTGRATDTFVNLRGKTRELLKLWTGKAGAPRREKIVLKVMQDAGQLDTSGIRVAKGRVVNVAPQPQLDCANKYYDMYVKKKRERLLDSLGVLPLGVFR
ncbi:kinase-like domain-containing protein [Dissophora ornata]|nr:kinase-like domain-containing protein [Dissophora ornata]